MVAPSVRVTGKRELRVLGNEVKVRVRAGRERAANLRKVPRRAEEVAESIVR